MNTHPSGLEWGCFLYVGVISRGFIYIGVLSRCFFTLMLYPDELGSPGRQTSMVSAFSDRGCWVGGHTTLISMRGCVGTEAIFNWGCVSCLNLWVGFCTVQHGVGGV